MLIIHEKTGRGSADRMLGCAAAVFLALPLLTECGSSKGPNGEPIGDASAQDGTSSSSGSGGGGSGGSGSGSGGGGGEGGSGGDSGQPWSGIISPARATNWSGAGIPGGIPSATWTQCGATIAAYGTAAAPGSPAAINNAIAGTAAGYTGCKAPYVILLGSGDFYLNASINLASNVVLRGGGANSTRIHFPDGGTYDCNGVSGASCIVGSNTYGGGCNPVGVGQTRPWPCPPGQYDTNGISGTANWTKGYSQGSTSITLDDVTGIVPNVTPIVLDQCDTGFVGTPGVETCTGVAGVITAANVYPSGGGTGYAVGDTGTIDPPIDFGRPYGSGTATYRVTGVSGGAVTALTITEGGNAYTYTNMASLFGSPTTTEKTSGSGSGFEVQITGVTGYDNSSVFQCAISMICADESDSGTARDGRSQAETIVATSISGTGPYTVTLSHPIMNPNWASTQAPEAWWGSSTITNAGIENLELDMSAISQGASGVVVGTAYQVWVKGIASSTANYLHVYSYVGSNIEVRDSYFYYTKNLATESYGIGSASAVSNALFENNIVQGVVSPLLAAGDCAGCVFDYNFTVNNAYTNTAFLFAEMGMHSSSTNYILTEGNVGSGVSLDTIHGPHFLNLFYRNYFDGYEADQGMLPTQNTIPIIIGAFSRYNNLVANVLGTSGYHKLYDCVPDSPTQQYCSTDFGTGPGVIHIFDLGWSHGAQIDYNNTPPEPNDPLTASSLLRWGNYDVVTGAARWCGNSSDTGWSTTCGSKSEVPTADPNFPNPVPTLGDTAAGQGALPASFLYSSKPSWWPSSTSWPPIGPDVTAGNLGLCSTGTYKASLALNGSQCGGGSFTSTVVDGHVNAIPAMACYLNTMNGPPDGTGAFLSFNAGTCYPR
jgi:hypothetical protein